MANNRNHETNMDDLLKQVLKDDLPPEVEGQMKAQFTQFQEKAVRGLKARRKMSPIPSQSGDHLLHCRHAKLLGQ